LAAVDTMACCLINLDPMQVPLLVASREQGYGRTALGEIRVVGDDWRGLCVADFKNIRNTVDLRRIAPLPGWMLQWIRQQWTDRPRIVAGRCTQCGICEQGCPVSPPVIHPQADVAGQVEDARCIRCYCCHEFCPSQAIVLEQPWLGRHLPLQALADGAGRLLGVLSSWRRR
jgi:ferredoxin